MAGDYDNTWAVLGVSERIWFDYGEDLFETQV